MKIGETLKKLLDWDPAIYGHHRSFTDDEVAKSRECRQTGRHNLNDEVAANEVV